MQKILRNNFLHGLRGKLKGIGSDLNAPNQIKLRAGHYMCSMNRKSCAFPCFHTRLIWTFGHSLWDKQKQKKEKVDSGEAETRREKNRKDRTSSGVCRISGTCRLHLLIIRVLTNMMEFYGSGINLSIFCVCICNKTKF